MGFFDFLKRKKKIHGHIGYFGLAEWWQSELSESDRNIILEVYQPMGSGSSSLTEGDIQHTTQTAIGLLSGMVEWFYKQENRFIAYKIIKKAESLIKQDGQVLDSHFLYHSKIKIAYKDRDILPDGLEKAIKSCEQQISYSKQAAQAFLKKYNNELLPGHHGFYQLAIVLEKKKKYDETITLCERALSEDWAGDWEHRIKRCKKKKNQKKPKAKLRSKLD